MENTQGDRISVLQRAMGEEFDRLHPKLRRQYAIKSGEGVMGRGRGVMTEITHGRAFMLPFLGLGARRLLLFPETGTDVDFSVENYAYVDPLGRETLTWTRVFHFPKPRRFDEYLVYSPRRQGLVIYAGSHQHLAVDLIPSVDADGALCLQTGGQRLYEWPLGISFPRFFSGIAQVRESFSDLRDRYEIEVTIDNPVFGHIFGYKGWFQHEDEPCDGIPPHVLPKRTERRD